MTIGQLTQELALFPPDSVFEIWYIPRSSEFSSAPEHPSTMYLAVDLEAGDVAEDRKPQLRKAGWREETEAYTWIKYF